MKTKCLLFFVTLFIVLLTSCSADPDIEDMGLGNTGGGGDPKTENNNSGVITKPTSNSSLNMGVGNTTGSGDPKDK